MDKNNNEVAATGNKKKNFLVRLIGEALLGFIMPLLTGIPLIAELYKRHEPSSIEIMVVRWSGFVISLVLVCTALNWLYKRSGGDLGWKLPKQGAGWALLTGVAVYGLTAVLMVISQKYHIFYQPQDSATTSSNATMMRGAMAPLVIFAASVGSPILEELGFRGIVLTRFTNLTHHYGLSVIIAALFFVVAHGEGVMGSISLFCFAVANSLLDRHYHSLMPGIVVHIAYNCIVSVSALVAMG